MWNWINLTGYNLLAVGTNLKYYIQNSSGGAYNDVTPIRLTSAGVSNAFTTTTLSTTVGVFTDSYIDAYIELKMQEVTRFRMTTHPLEFDMYYSL